MKGLRIAMSNSNSNLNQVLIPIIRRVMPSVIATEIVGVQPMAGDDCFIFNLNRANPKHCYE